MKKIWKFPIKPYSFENEVVNLAVPAPVGAKPLCVMNQNGVIVLYAEVDPAEKQMGIMDLFCIGTGHGRVPDNARYLNSVCDGPHVWHFYVPK